VLQGLTGYPVRRTRLVVVRTPSLETMRTVRLRGAFSVDAVSPGGRWLYLVHDFTGRGGLRYEVRAYDLVHHRLLPRPIVDPREPDEKMLGVATTRTVSADGRWAYTLYDRNGKAPFIHALDTERARARCVDLDVLAGRGDVGRMTLGSGRGGSILVRNESGRSVLVVEARTFAVRAPRAAVPRESSGGVDWAPLAGIGVLALLAAGALKIGGAARRANFGH
jgi:hypothetical protein